MYINIVYTSSHGNTLCHHSFMVFSFVFLHPTRGTRVSGLLPKREGPPSLVSDLTTSDGLGLAEVELPLDIEEDVGLAAAHRLEVRLPDRAVVEMIPGLDRRKQNID